MGVSRLELGVVVVDDGCDIGSSRAIKNGSAPSRGVPFKTIKGGTDVLGRGTEGSILDVRGATVSFGGGTVSGGRVSVVRGISIFGFSSTVVGGLVVSMGCASIGCAIVPVGTATTGSVTTRTGAMVIGET